MKRLVAFLIVTSFFYFQSYTKGQTPTGHSESKGLTIPTGDTAFSPRQAHPKAKALLTDAIYWSFTEESAPFGNDEGVTAFKGFQKWRPLNPKRSPVLYLHELITGWDYPAFDLKTVTLDEISAYITSGSSGASALIGQDNAIIAIGFGQFVLEGKMDADIWILTRIALQRELLPVLLSHFPEDYQPKRRELLSKLLTVVETMN